MKLFYSPGACSLSPHIALRESGLAFELVKVDLKTKLTESGSEFNLINPKSSVPVLQLGGGDYLTEGPAILQYVADQVPTKHLAPPLGTIERYRLMEWLNFIATELHKSYSPLFKAGSTDDVKQAAVARLYDRFALVATQLGKTDYLLGENFTVADAYLYVMLFWAAHLQIDLGRWAALGMYQARVGARPAVREALLAEGLVKG
jgi:glutathione S-transferase